MGAARIIRSTDRGLPGDMRKLFDECIGKPTYRQIVATSLTTTKAFAADQAMTIVGVANQSEPDRWRELMPPECWKEYLPQYMLNPQILREHDRHRVVGKALKVEVKKDGLHFEAEIGNPALGELTLDQREVRSLLAQGYYRTNSVGFIPHVIEYDEDEDLLIYKVVELLEISIVSIPMQQGSFITSVKAWRQRSMSGNQRSKDESGTGGNDAMAKIDQTCSENLSVTKACHDMLTKLSNAGADEAKALREELVTVKAERDAARTALVELEAQSKALLDGLVAKGLVAKPEETTAA